MSELERLRKAAEGKAFPFSNETCMRLLVVAEAARHDQYDPPHRPGICGVCDALAALESSQPKQND